MPDQYSNTRRAEPILSELELYSEYRNCDRWAIIVGISRYRYQGWNLRYADRDAEELYSLLLTPSGGNFKKEFIRKLTNEEATTGNITRALRAFLKKPAREDLVVIYFACHGAPDFDRPGNVYLLTHDTAPDDIAGTALPMREIDLSLKENLHAEKVIVLADTCHSAAIGGGIGRRSAVDDSTFVNRYLQEVSRARGGIALLTSAEANEVSFEDARWGGGHGVFTHYLLEGMRGAADRDGNGIVTVGELFEYVRDNVKRATDYRQHPLIGANAYDRNLPMAIAPGTNFSKTPEDYQQRYQEPSYTPRSEPRQAVAESFDLTLELWLTAEEMTKGTEKPVFTGQEDITVNIPAGVSSGKRIRVRGKGKFNARTRQRGDLYLLLKSLISIEVGTYSSSVLGIDLRTSNSSMAIIQDGKVAVIPNREGSLTTPSVVAYTNWGGCLVGQNAQLQAGENPQNTFEGILRFIGREYDEVSEEVKQVSYKVVKGDKDSIKIECPALGRQLAPEEIISHILRKLADDAKTSLKRAVNQVVISVPSCWDTVQRFTVKEAAELAGLEVLRIVNSTSLAILPYDFLTEEKQVVLVVDIDFNYFTASFIVIDDGAYDVCGIFGDTHLGIQDFDRRIANWFIEELKRIEGIYLPSDSSIIRKLNQEAEKARINLSSVDQVEINLSEIINQTISKQIKLTLTRHKFDELCASLIERCRAKIEDIISLLESINYDGKLSRNDISNVVLLGSSAQIPVIQNLIKQILGKNSIQSFGSDIAAVLGAGIQGGVLYGVVKDVLLLDCIPLSLGVQAQGGSMVQIIPGNTTIPTKRGKTFCTLSNNQTGIGIHILEGEHRLAKFNKSLGILYFDIPPTSQNTPEIEITFDIDAANKLIVSALDKKSGIKRDMQIDRTTSLTKSEVDKISRRYGEGLLELRLKE